MFAFLASVNTTAVLQCSSSIQTFMFDQCSIQSSAPPCPIQSSASCPPLYIAPSKPLERNIHSPSCEGFVPLCVAFARRFSLFIVGSIAAYIFSGSIVGIFLSKGVITSAFLSHLRNDLSLPHHDGFFAAPSILSLNLRYARLRIFVRHHTWLCPLYASTRGSLWIQVAPYTRTTPNLSSTIPLT